MCLRSLIFSCTHTHTEILYFGWTLWKIEFYKKVLFLSESYTKKYLPKHQGVHAVIYCTKQHLSDVLTHTQLEDKMVKWNVGSNFYQQFFTELHHIFILHNNNSKNLNKGCSHAYVFSPCFIRMVFHMHILFSHSLTSAEDVRVQSNIIK
jgi:hypothetical protein